MRTSQHRQSGNSWKEWPPKSFVFCERKKGFRGHIGHAIYGLEGQNGWRRNCDLLAIDGQKELLTVDLLTMFRVECFSC